MRRQSLFSVLLIAFGLAWSCARPTEPLPYQLPEPDTSRDPAALRIGTLLYRCGAWTIGTPPQDTAVVVDVTFGSEPFDHPPDSSKQIVRSTGGVILHEFEFPAVRVWIPTRLVPQLAAHVYSVVTVPDARRYDWRVIVQYRSAVTDADTAKYRLLGGKVLNVFTAFAMVSAAIPERGAMALRADGRVQFVSLDPPFSYCD
jgi:hypothetical protein